MTETVGGFCRDLLDEHEQGKRLNPEIIAARFVEYFNVSTRPTLEELTGLMRRAGFGEVSEMSLDQGPKGLHLGAPRREYHIYYRDDLWDGARDLTVLHEDYEIIHETLWDMHSASKPVLDVCREANRFAAAVLMQPEEFSRLAEASGLDLLALQREYRCAYAAVALRLAEVVRRPPLLVVLYERPEQGDPAQWPAGDDVAQLRATVIKRTAGFVPGRSRLTGGRRGGIPWKGKSLPPGSLAEQAARSGRPEYAEGDGFAVVAQPVIWKGRLAKMSVVAVPCGERGALLPHLAAVSYQHSGRLATAAS